MGTNHTTPPPTARTTHNAARWLSIRKADDRIQIYLAARLDHDTEQLTLTEAERKIAHELAPILAQSPRALKRFVNVYSLLKVALSNEERALLLESRLPNGTETLMSNTAAIQFLLAIGTGLPEAMPEIQRALNNLEIDQFQGFLAKLAKSMMFGDQDRQAWLKQVSQATPLGGFRDFLLNQETGRIFHIEHFDLDQLRYWNRHTARFSFHLGSSGA